MPFQFSHRRLWTRILVVVGLAALLTSCSAFKGYPDRVVDRETELLMLKDDLNAKAVQECLGKIDTIA
jgi:hypothetical protein